ncbi:alpha/beta hydrolase [Neomicrococcus aestuarii]|uniref:alpha/beta hydrolase n=1 Tax=Neomicrococcus aestuarii TaxID=556325 RepID=UPI000A896BE6|nr:alpha/beta fold hydrolase [Neomicrococcus aestuarii]
MNTALPAPQPPLDPTQPFTVLRPGSTAVLVIHGFTGSPLSVRPWANAFLEAGFSVSVPLLPGHGTRWEDLNNTSYKAYINAVSAHFDRLRREHENVVVAGLSMGGTLALHLGEIRDPAGIITVNPSLKFASPTASLAPALRWVVKSVEPIRDDIAKRGVTEGAYSRTPVGGVAELGKLMAVTRGKLSQITAPVLLFRSATDHVVPDSSIKILEKGLAKNPLKGSNVQVTALPNSFHVATLDYDAAAIESGSVAFVRGLVK